jgi:hypothetical protein
VWDARGGDSQDGGRVHGVALEESKAICMEFEVPTRSLQEWGGPGVPCLLFWE